MFVSMLRLGLQNCNSPPHYGIRITNIVQFLPSFKRSRPDMNIFTAINSLISEALLNVPAVDFARKRVGGFTSCCLRGEITNCCWEGDSQVVVAERDSQLVDLDESCSTMRVTTCFSVVGSFWTIGECACCSVSWSCVIGGVVVHYEDSLTVLRRLHEFPHVMFVLVADLVRLYCRL